MTNVTYKFRNLLFWQWQTTISIFGIGNEYYTWPDKSSGNFEHYTMKMAIFHIFCGILPHLLPFLTVIGRYFTQIELFKLTLCSLIATYFTINRRRNLCVWRTATRKDQTLDKQSIPRESTYTVFHVKHGNTEYSIGSTESEMLRRNANTKRVKKESPSY